MKIISIKYDYDKEMYIISHVSKNMNGAEVIKTVSVKELTPEMKTFVSDSTVIQTENTTYWKYLMEDIIMKDLTKMTAPEVWDYFVELRGYREPSGDLEDDGFFNDKFLCIKYGDWDIENECRKYDVTNAELRSMLDKKEIADYIKYMQLCIEELG